MHVFIRSVSIVTTAVMSELKFTHRVTLSLTSTEGSISLSLFLSVCLSLFHPPTHRLPDTQLAPTQRKRPSCYWDLKQEEHVPPLSFSNWGEIVLGTSDWSMSFSLAMMCFTRQVAASSMLMFS